MKSYKKPRDEEVEPEDLEDTDEETEEIAEETDDEDDDIKENSEEEEVEDMGYKKPKKKIVKDEDDFEEDEEVEEKPKAQAKPQKSNKEEAIWTPFSQPEMRGLMNSQTKEFLQEGEILSKILNLLEQIKNKL